MGELGSTKEMVPLPLSALLSQVLVAYTVELDNGFELRMVRAGFPGARLSLVLWLNVLRLLPSEGLTFRDLADRYVGPPDSLKIQLGYLERWWVIEMSSGNPTSRQKRDGWGSGRGITRSTTIQLTTIGKKAVEIWPVLLSEIEDRWRKRFEKEEIHRISKSLQKIVQSSEVELPLGLSSILDLDEREYKPRPAKKEAPLAFVMLVSQVLFLFAGEFQKRSRLPLLICANMIRVLGENPVRLGDLPRLTGGSAETSDVGWRLKPFVILENDPAGKRGKVIRLSERGARAQDAYYQTTRDIEKDWAEKFGADNIRGLRSNLEKLLARKEFSLGLVPPKGVARGGTPTPALGRRDVGVAAKQRMHDLVEQTQRFIEAPRESLPHYPMWDFNRGFGP